MQNKEDGRAADILADTIRTLARREGILRVAIDGRCGSGKTTLARMLRNRLECCVIHMDDFFPRPSQRTPERYREPGGNVDYERFESEVLRPLCEGRAFSYRPYDCRTQSLKDPVPVQPQAVTIIEGSYSCHPVLWNYYHLHLFLTVDEEEQMRRIILRNGREKADEFRTRWIPLEEAYFAAFPIEKESEIVLDTQKKTLTEAGRLLDLNE